MALAYASAAPLETVRVAAAADKKTRPAASAGRAKPGPAVIAAAVVVLALAGVGAGWYFAERKARLADAADAEAAKPVLPAPAQYFPLDPPFVVNLNAPMEGPRYLQVEVQLMTRDPVVLKNMELHAPAIRSALLMLFSQQTAENIGDHAGREALKEQALTEVKRVLQAETRNDAVEGLLFTSFVSQ